MIEPLAPDANPVEHLRNVTAKLNEVIEAVNRFDATLTALLHPIGVQGVTPEQIAEIEGGAWREYGASGP